MRKRRRPISREMRGGGSCLKTVLWGSSEKARRSICHLQYDGPPKIPQLIYWEGGGVEQFCSEGEGGFLQREC